MKTLLKGFVFVLIIFVIANTAIINIPSDQLTIQNGINAATEGDTVLLQPGIYYEHINLNGKKIVLGSLFVTTGDTSYISQTIIDGYQSGLVVTIQSGEDSTTLLIGFTVSNGRDGGIYCSQSNPVFKNLKIIDNSSGGIRFIDCAKPILENIKIINNSADNGGGIYCSSSSPSFKNVEISGNSANSGAGIYCSQSNPSFEIVKILSNSASGGGGGIYSVNSSPTLCNVIISGNSAGTGGGIYFSNSNAIIINASINSNYSSNSAAGIYCGNFSCPRLERVNIFHNSSGYWCGGIYCHNSNPNLINVTIVSNESTVGGGLVCVDNSSPSLINSLFWNNSPQEIYFSPSGDPDTIAIAYSNIQGGKSGIITNSNGTVHWLHGNIESDPMFVDEENSDYHLRFGSPCIDGGTPFFVWQGETLIDVSEGDYCGTSPDIGRFEFDKEVIQISIQSDSMFAYVGDTIIVPINIIFPVDSTYSSAEISFNGYQEGLEFIEVITDSSLFGYADWDIQINETDSLLITASAGSDEISGEGILFFLKFMFSETVDTGYIPINIEYIIFDNGDSPVDITNGFIYVKSKKLPTIYGDVDLNGEIRAYDASLILKYLVDYITLEEQQLLNADVTLDSSISALDASLILQYVADIIDTLPYDTSNGSLFASGDMSMEDGEIQAGQKVEVPLYLINGYNILSFEGLLTFNYEHLTFDSLEYSEFLDSFRVEINSNSGEIKFAGAGTLPDGKEGIFSTLEFTVNENFDENETTISLDKIRWNEEPVMQNVAVATLSKIVTIDDNIRGIPNEFSLAQNYPNPFNPTTMISYQLPKSTFVNLSIYNVNGQLIETLVDKQQQAGYYSVSWNASSFCSGVYLYKIEAENFSDAKKCLIVK